MRTAQLFLGIVGLCGLAAFDPARAVLFYATGDPEYHTTAPGGAYADSGWQWQGLWSYAQGTVVAPRYFLTAGHVEGKVGDAFVFQGRTYLTAEIYDDPETDLRLARVCGVFASFAPLQTAEDEVGRDALIFGRGTQRGTELTLTNGLRTELKGWLWGPYDGRMRWGRNRVEEVLDGGTGFGALLRAAFDSDGLAEECHLSLADSGGAVFLQDGSAWRLAGINLSVDGPYNTAATGDGFQAAVFDEGGLFVQEDSVWVPRLDLPRSQPGNFYATRLAPRAAWIASILAQPLPAAEKIVLQSASDPAGPFVDESAAVVDEVARTITLALPAGPRFFRVRSCFGAHLLPPRIQSGNLVLPFE